MDPDPGGPPSTVRSARLAFAAAAPDATHHLVVQDDVILPDGFAEHVRQAMAKQPNAAVSLFVEWGSRTAMLARWAVLVGSHWVPVINPYIPTQALALPAAVARELSRYLWSEATIDEPDDRAILRFLRREHVPAVVPVPNLVEHLDLPSLTGNDNHGARRSVCWRPHAALSGDQGVLDVPPLLPFLDWATGAAVMVDTADAFANAQRPTAEVLRDWGYDEAAVANALSEALRRADCGALVAAVGERYLCQMWLTAVAMGAVARQHWPASASALAGPVNETLAEALYTLTPGALRRHLDPDRLTAFRGELTGLMVDAMRFGSAR
jgi:hypothetical protein